MISLDKRSDDAAPKASSGPALRQRDEDADRQTAAAAQENMQALSSESAQHVLHDLRVHQIELEMQNEELRRVQVELETARTRYFELYDLAPVGYCTLGEQGLIRQSNLTAASLLGLARGALVRQPISRFIVKADQDIYYLCRQKLIASGEPQTCELRMVKADGAQFWVRLATTIAQDADGAPEVHLTLSDVTDGKLTELKLQESEKRYRTLVEWSPEPIAVHCDGVIIYVNPSAIEMFGAQSMQDLMGKNMLDLVHPDFHQAMLARLKTATRQGVGTPMVEKRFFKLDGTIIDVEVQSASIIYDGVPAIQVAMRDVTEHRRLDRILHERNVELENARWIAEKANQAKSDFLSSMSHELRTPLSAILGFAQLMESGSPSPTLSQKRSIEQILKAGWYLLELINEILDLALIESGKLSLSLEPISLSEVMHESQAMIEAQAQLRGISVSFTPFAIPYFVSADRTRVKQVLINLLSNAIKYNKAGGTVAVDYALSSPDTIRISVRDSGFGLAAEQLVQLFQPFNRLGQESGSEQGTGVGLVVSKRLVELMGGVIGVESTVGQGSVFWFELNLTTDPQMTAGAFDPRVFDAAHVHLGAPLRTLLYVEDNPANLMLVEEIIARRPDIRLLSARDGITGIELAHTSRPDVILMDINLPGISGLEVLKILARDPATAHIPVVALSANAMPHDIEKGLEAGFFRYLTKPIKVYEFMDTLDMALEVAKTTTGRAASNQEKSR